MKPTRPSALAVVAVIFAVLAWLLLRLIYQRLPPLPWTGVPALLLAAAAEVLIGRDLRARIAGRRAGKPAEPLFVSRLVALAPSPPAPLTPPRGGAGGGGPRGGGGGRRRPSRCSCRGWSRWPRPVRWWPRWWPGLRRGLTFHLAGPKAEEHKAEFQSLY